MSRSCRFPLFTDPGKHILIHVVEIGILNFRPLKDLYAVVLLIYLLPYKYVT